MDNFIGLLDKTANLFNPFYLAIGVAGVIALIFIVFLFVGSKSVFFYISLILFLLELLIFSFLKEETNDFKRVSVILTALEICVFTLILKIPFSRKLKKSNIEDFIKSIDMEMKKEKKDDNEDILESLPRNNMFSEKVKESVKSYNEKKELGNVNLEHARSLVDRLNYYHLTIEDKKKLFGIEEYIAGAETNNDIDKDGLNEKLAELIKILAKYNA